MTGFGGSTSTTDSPVDADQQNHHIDYIVLMKITADLLVTDTIHPVFRRLLGLFMVGQPPPVAITTRTILSIPEALSCLLTMVEIWWHSRHRL
jgi:hypothetical protein